MRINFISVIIYILSPVVHEFQTEVASSSLDEFSKEYGTRKDPLDLFFFFKWVTGELIHS